MVTNALIMEEYQCSAHCRQEVKHSCDGVLIGLTESRQLLLETGGILWVMFHRLSACQL